MLRISKPAINRNNTQFKGKDTSQDSCKPRTPINCKIEDNRVLFVSDLDGTWLNKDARIRELIDTEVPGLVKKYADKGIELIFGYVTGRPPERLISENLPQPNWSITYNGASIHQGLPAPEKKPFAPWEFMQKMSRFNSGEVKEAIKELKKLDKYKNFDIKPMSEILNSPCVNASKYTQPFCIISESIKLSDKEKSDSVLEEKSYRTPDQVNEFIGELKESLSKKGVKYDITDPYLAKNLPSSSIVIDVSGRFAQKGAAVEFLRNILGIKPENTIIAIDGGNDVSMIKNDGRCVTVVGPNSPLRTNAALQMKNRVELRSSEEASSIGVLQGLKNHLTEIYDRIAGSRQE